MKLLSIEEEAAACREAFKGSKVGDFAWHVHHEKLAESLSEPAENRIAYILAQKPESEQALRLRLMRPVKSAAAAPAWKAYYAAAAPAQEAYYAAAAPAQEAYYAAAAPAQETYDAAIASAHSKECPGCPFRNGTIFPESK